MIRHRPAEGIPEHGAPLDVDARHRIVTDQSTWIIHAGTYVRMPRIEAPRPAIADVVDGALIDVVLHAHRGGVWEWDAAGLRLRIYPAARPVGSHGVVTGPILILDGQPLLGNSPSSGSVTGSASSPPHPEH